MAFPKLLQRLFQNNGAGDKLNQDIIPDIPYSKITDAPSIDSALSSTSENPVQNKIINAALNEKLSLTGGTMAGGIYFGGSKDFAILATDDTSSLTLAGGTSSSYADKAGAALILSGKKSITGGIPSGYFSLTAADGTSRATLFGAPEGSLSWNGKNILTGNSAGLTVVAESYGANSWYRKYSDGWIEQGIKIENNPGGAQTFTLATPFSTTNYTIAVSQNGGASRSISRAAIEAVTRSSVTVYIDSANMLPVRMYMCGK